MKGILGHMNRKEDVLQYIVFSRKEKNSIRRKVREYEIINSGHINTVHKSMLILLGADFVLNLTRFFNQDVLLNACICKSIGKTSKEKLSYYLEIFYTKLVTCWEYLFVYINEYLQTGLLPNEQVKVELIESNMYEQIHIQHEEYIEIKRVPYNEEKQKIIRKNLRKSLVVLSPNALKSKINEMYEESELIKNIFECYSDEMVIDAKHIRNRIIHSDSIQKNYSFGINQVFGGTAICGRSGEFYDEMVNKIDGNIKLLRKAILLFKEMVYEDKLPNHIENKGRKYIVYDYVCQECKETEVIPDMLDEFFVEFGKCPKCGCEVFSEKKEFQVSELFYGTRVSDLLKNFN